MGSEEISNAVDWARQMRLLLSPKQILTEDGYIYQDFFKPDKVSDISNWLHDSPVCDLKESLHDLKLYKPVKYNRSYCIASQHRTANLGNPITEDNLVCRL